MHFHSSLQGNPPVGRVRNRLDLFHCPQTVHPHQCLSVFAVCLLKNTNRNFFKILQIMLYLTVLFVEYWWCVWLFITWTIDGTLIGTYLTRFIISLAIINNNTHTFLQINKRIYEDKKTARVSSLWCQSEPLNTGVTMWTTMWTYFGMNVYNTRWQESTVCHKLLK